MTLQPFEKLVIKQMNERINAHVIGIKIEPNGTKVYILESLTKSFVRSKTGSKIMRVNSLDIENDRISIEKHII